MLSFKVKPTVVAQVETERQYDFEPTAEFQSTTFSQRDATDTDVPEPDNFRPTFDFSSETRQTYYDLPPTPNSNPFVPATEPVIGNLSQSYAAHDTADAALDVDNTQLVEPVTADAFLLGSLKFPTSFSEEPAFEEPVTADAFAVESVNFPTSFSDHFASAERELEEPVNIDAFAVESVNLSVSFSDHFASEEPAFDEQSLNQPNIDVSLPINRVDQQQSGSNPFVSQADVIDETYATAEDQYSEQQHQDISSLSTADEEQHARNNPFVSESVSVPDYDKQVVVQDWPNEAFTEPLIASANDEQQIPQSLPLGAAVAAETPEWQASFDSPQQPKQPWSAFDDDAQPLIAELSAEKNPRINSEEHWPDTSADSQALLETESDENRSEEHSPDVCTSADSQRLPETESDENICISADSQRLPETESDENRSDAPLSETVASSLSPPHEQSFPPQQQPAYVDTSFEDWVGRNEMSCAEPVADVYAEEHDGMMTTVSYDIREDEPDVPVDAVVHRETIEGEEEVRIELDDDEQTLDDGTVLQRQTITKNYIRPMTNVTLTDGIETDWLTTDRIVRIEIEETILALPHGVTSDLDERSDLDTRVEVSECEEQLEDGTPVRRKITRTTVFPVEQGSGAEQQTYERKSRLAGGKRLITHG